MLFAFISGQLLSEASQERRINGPLIKDFIKSEGAVRRGVPSLTGCCTASPNEHRQSDTGLECRLYVGWPIVPN